MGVTVRMIAPHSGSKDHLAMAGGTLTADKVVDGDGPLTAVQHFFPMAEFDPAASAGELRELFSGIHSIEHALASPLAGDLRGRDEAVGAGLVDMSPFIPGLGDGGAARRVIGFRSTYVTDGDASAPATMAARMAVRMAAAYREALGLIRAHFERGEDVPFATPESCGQYDMHSPQAALDLIASAPPVDEPDERRTDLGARRLYVCDLRLVKPRLPGAADQRMLDPLAGHLISQAVESAGLISGNFGCSTGQYLLTPTLAPAGEGAPASAAAGAGAGAANEDVAAAAANGDAAPGAADPHAAAAGAADEDAAAQAAVLHRAHATVAETLQHLASYIGPDPLLRAAASDADFALTHISHVAPEVLPTPS